MLKNYLSALRRDNFDDNKQRVNMENQLGVELILLFYSIILAFNLISELGKPEPFVHNTTLIAQTIYIVIALAVYFLVLRRRDANYTVAIYLLETPMLLITMIGGIVNRPNEITFTFLVFLLLFPLLILDKPWRIIMFDLIMSMLYLGIARAYKDPSVFPHDAIHLVNVLLMTISASLFFLSARIRNIEFAKVFAQKSEEDPLTSIYNREGARRHIDPKQPSILVYLDLDRFKEVNDRFGHEEGDKVLVETAALLCQSFRGNDVIVRMGGDEFAVYAPGTWSQEKAEAKLAELSESIHSITFVGDDGQEVMMTASIGCAYAPHGCGSLDELVRDADEEMYLAKRGGKNRYCLAAV